MADIDTPKPIKPRTFSDQLMEAAARVGELPNEEVARLMMKAAIRLRVVQETGIKLEHIPVAAYHLLRRISRGPVAASDEMGHDEEQAVGFLLSRDLIVKSDDGSQLSITAAGEELGEIADERI
ncbi:hypothetical protein [Devosia sp.]|uniref:hypothetical protein n=1 Tax=Devosia sp. TaxID=1871048 RepID=UPI003263C3CF